MIMDLRKIITLIGMAVFFAIFISLGYMMSIAPLPVFPLAQFTEFSRALWHLRRLDVFIQIVLIFSCALGILTFFPERKI